MVKVLKKCGKKQAFSPAKLKRSIEKAAKEAKLIPTKTKELVKEVAEPVIALAKKKRLVKVVDLRRSVLGRIERRSKKVAASWRRYDKKKKK